MSALFIALIALTSQIMIPLPMVPVNLALLGVFLCAALLPGTDSLFAVAGYLLLGLIGAPVFSNFRGGPSVLFDKTGGYLLGYLLCAGVIVLWKKKSFKSPMSRVLAFTSGLMVCYVTGTAWLMCSAGLSLPAALSVGMLPFLPGDAVKVVLAVWLSLRLDKALGKKGSVGGFHPPTLNSE